MTCLGATEIKWPKDTSGGPKISKLTGGLVKAQPEATVSPLS